MKGLIAGAIAAVIMFFFINSFQWLGLTKYDQTYLAGNTVFDYRPGWFMFIIALLVTIGIGIFWGVIFAFLFSKVFTNKHWIIKSIFISFSIFVLHLGILDESFHYPRKIHEETLDILVFLLGYAVYGVITTWLLLKMGICQDAIIDESPPAPS